MGCHVFHVNPILYLNDNYVQAYSLQSSQIYAPQFFIKVTVQIRQFHFSPSHQITHLQTKYRLNLKTKGSTEFITQRPWAVAPERSKGATKGLRVINYVDHVGFEV